MTKLIDGTWQLIDDTTMGAAPYTATSLNWQNWRRMDADNIPLNELKDHLKHVDCCSKGACSINWRPQKSA